ncbi:unnamed protein product [Nippostrongylus brasiliensis]|uniref:DUF5641 domain-containing protein n=1 Tax=Nippostrongylus brasiliensis TaxID=27835 RepID=A0A0N4Y359_NIPBR|nr:hypothetical protein Q1695_003727 [Nippostrongylus brasiliensis]VDL73806.1 unnamed protein product [Nippostrongylus brasiliensis]
MDDKRAGTTPPTVGTVVLLSGPDIPRNGWKMGRIAELKKSTDSLTREAVVYTPNGKYSRGPINQLIPLELEDQEEVNDEENGKEGTIFIQTQEQHNDTVSVQLAETQAGKL